MNPNLEPTKEYEEICKKRLGSLWQNLPEMEKYADLLPKGERKQYLQAINQVMSFVGELYFFNAVTFGELQKMRMQFQPLYKEIFGDNGISLPYIPEDNETLRDAVKRYKEKEPFIDWNVRTLKEKAKETEENHE